MPKKLGLPKTSDGGIDDHAIKIEADEAGSDEANDHERPLRKSCDACNEKRIKCSGELDGCSYCERHGIQCHYSTFQTRKRVVEAARSEPFMTDYAKRKKTTYMPIVNAAQDGAMLYSRLTVPQLAVYAATRGYKKPANQPGKRAEHVRSRIIELLREQDRAKGLPVERIDIHVRTSKREGSTQNDTPRPKKSKKQANYNLLSHIEGVAHNEPNSTIGLQTSKGPVGAIDANALTLLHLSTCRARGFVPRQTPSEGFLCGPRALADAVNYTRMQYARENEDDAYGLNPPPMLDWRQCLAMLFEDDKDSEGCDKNIGIPTTEYDMWIRSHWE